MKRIITIISAVAALFIVSACTDLGGPAANQDGYLLKLDLRCGELQTRTAGDDTYHENDINVVDYFFFSDEAGTTPLGIHGRVTLPTENGLTFDTSLEQYAALKHTSYVYVLANYPGEIDHANTNPTLATLLALPVDKALYTPADEDANTPAALADSFVMDSYDPATDKYTVQLKPAASEEERTQTITLSRLAVKLTVTLTIDASITTVNAITGGNEVWTPLQDQMQIYYVNALNNTTVQATPVKRTSNTTGTYFSYPTDYGYTPATEDEGCLTFTTDPAYTYPQSWTADDNGEPYFKLYLPWSSTIVGNSNFYYKIPVEEGLSKNPKVTDKTLKRNCWYQVNLRVGVLGGTENDYVVVTGEYCVADWAEPAWFSGSGLNSAKYFYVPGTEYHIYGDDHIDIPYYCNAAVNAYFTNITYIDYNSGNNGATVTRSKPFTGTGNTSVTDYGGTGNHTYTLTPDAENKVVSFQHDMTDLYVERDITLMIVNSENASQSQQVVIHQHPAIELKKANGGDVYVNGRFARVANARNQNGGTMGVNHNNSGNYHSPASNSNWHNVTQVGGYVLEKAAINGYGCLLYEPFWISLPYFTTDITVTAFSNSNKTYSISDDNGNQTITYKIGDPRVKVSTVYNNFSLAQYLASGTTTGNSSYGDWSNQGDILIGSNADNDHNIIAPRILVCSGSSEVYTPGGIPDGGGNGNGGGYNLTNLVLNFVKRAATFQEAGYPAGRWRLPTEAEVAFIVARQVDGTIPEIFARGYPYLCSSGRWVLVPVSGSTLEFGTDNRYITTSMKTGYVYDSIDAKFVYDLWYWGDQPANTDYVTNQYHPNGHVVSYK